MSKTLLFTTSYCTDDNTWKERIFNWYKYFSSSSLIYDKLLILDDSSPILPVWKDVHNIVSPFTKEPREKNLLISLRPHLGRPGVLDYPGWFRSFSFAAKYAVKFNYSKVIHIESDAYFISKRLFLYTNSLQKGWVSLWCSLYQFPETAIQIICEDQLLNFYKTTQLNYNSYFKNKAIEECLPFTSIAKEYKGDRYNEYREDIPVDADFACQVKSAHILPQSP